MDLLWPAALDDDPACRFVGDAITTRECPHPGR